MKTRKAYKYTNDVKAKILKEYVKRDDLTYNAFGEEYGVHACVVRDVDRIAREKGLITSRAKKVHTAEIRKTRVATDDSMVEKMFKVFQKYPTLSIQKVGWEVGISHGAAYNIHDKLVKEGRIVSRRRVRTSTAKKPPLYMIEFLFIEASKSDSSLSIGKLAKKAGISEMHGYKIHDRLVEQGLIKSHRRFH